MRTAFQPTAPAGRRTLHSGSTSHERRTVNVNRKRATAAVIAVLAVTAMTLTAWTSLAGAASTKQSGTLAGAGSTFVVPLVTKWTQAYSPSKIDFGASDAPLSRDQFAACKGCVQVPWAFSATSIPYNVSGVGYGLKLTGKILAGIYGGSIRYWDNPAIKKINQG